VSRLLLDSHVVIWWDDGSRKLGKNTKKAIENAHSVFVSAVSEWELAIKTALGKVALRRSILEAAVDAGFETLPISFEHAQAVRSLKPIHKDPFDRLLVAIARVEGLSLVSSDTSLDQYAITVIDART
jgi:PIN domain nuclease of toxin-antitoxin system